MNDTSGKPNYGGFLVVGAFVFTLIGFWLGARIVEQSVSDLELARLVLTLFMSIFGAFGIFVGIALDRLVRGESIRLIVEWLAMVSILLMLLVLIAAGVIPAY